MERREKSLVPAKVQIPELLTFNECVKQNSLFLTLKPHPVDAPLCSFDKQFIWYWCPQWKYVLISIYCLLEQWIAMLLLCQLVQCPCLPITGSRRHGVCHQDGQECTQSFLRLLLIQDCLGVTSKDMIDNRSWAEWLGRVNILQGKHIC